MAKPFREYCAFGPRLNGTGTSFHRPENFVVDAYNTYIAPVLALNSTAFDTVHPAVAYGARWKDLYVNQNLAPANQAQAQDPNWSNFIWNQPNAGGIAYDSLTQALNHPQCANGAGRLKIEFSIAVSASGQKEALPAWFKTNPGYYCVPTNSSEHIEYTNLAAVQHSVDVMIAVIKKYGANKGLHSIGLSEAFTQGCPVGTGYFNNHGPFTWDQVHAAAPVDSDGKTVQIKQISPIFNQGVSYSDLEDDSTGYAQTDIELRFPPSSYPLTQHTEDLFNRNVVHVTSRGDYQKVLWGCPGNPNNRTYNWDNAPTNPWGLTGNHAASFEQFLWYHSATGPAPCDSIFYGPGYDACTNARWQNQIIQKSADWLEGGAMHGTWGPMPSHRRCAANASTHTVDPNQTIPLHYAGGSVFEA